MNRRTIAIVRRVVDTSDVDRVVIHVEPKIVPCPNCAGAGTLPAVDEASLRPLCRRCGGAGKIKIIARVDP